MKVKNLDDALNLRTKFLLRLAWHLAWPSICSRRIGIWRYHIEVLTVERAEYKFVVY